MGRLFGTDGVRGLANVDLTGELAYRLGRAAVIALGYEGAQRPQLAVGRDTRASGEFLEAALVAGICSAGGDAVLLGVSTTPQVAFSTAQLGTDAGVVISASHNPAEYNGIKFFGRRGYKLPDDVEDEVERLASAGGGRYPAGRDIGRLHPAPEARERYVEHLEQSADARLDSMRVVVDCANGAASFVAEELLRRLGADVISINDQPDGWNINLESGAMSPQIVAEAVVGAEADAGVAYDGDADRALFSDNEGNVIDGDQVLAACALGMQEAAELAGDVVVTTVMANLGFRRCMEDAGIRVLETRVGDRYVLEGMLREGAVLGGEQSGHVIFLRHATTGDGILTTVRFLGLARRTGVSVKDLAGRMPRFPQVLRNVPVPQPGRLEGADRVWKAVNAVEEALGDAGRVLVRASGTEPLVRVMVEAPSHEEADARAQYVADAVLAELGDRP